MISLSTTAAMAIAVALLFALTRRVYTSLVGALYLLIVVLISSWVKEAHLGVALTLADVKFFLLRPAENFKLFLNYPNLGVALIALIAGLIACVLIGMRYERVRPTMMRPVGKWFQFGSAFAAVAIAASGSVFAARDPQARADNGASYEAFLAMYEMQNVKGPIARLNVFFNNRSMEASLPEMRVQSRFVAGQAQALSDTAASRPDIMLVLEESVFDPLLLPDCPSALCDSALLHPPKAAKRTLQGPLLTHTTGGGTWLAEFAVLSGLDWRVFGRGGAYAPVSLAPRLRRSLPNYLRELGYRTVAVYPTDGNFLSATLAYDYYGFDEFYDRRDLALGDDWPEVRDGMVFDKALALIERADDARPVFVFVLTIRNHGPHGRDEKKIPREFAALAKQKNSALADFLARMRDSSEDYAALAATWLSAERPRVIAWFGDHQPEAAWDFTVNLKALNSKRVANNVSLEHSQYLTYFQFAANFGAAVRTTTAHALDLSYLGSELLSFAQLPLDDAAIAAHAAAQACNGLMLDCADKDLIGDYVSFRIHDLRSID